MRTERSKKKKTLEEKGLCGCTNACELPRVLNCADIFSSRISVRAKYPRALLGEWTAHPPCDLHRPFCRGFEFRHRRRHGLRV
ncbi:hypothetical protein PoB_002638500 [Plakobranchus ocellatus]|uniref:Uncharacterized protein n=1 Tax=Plakobranchus ocellatus TaxID=259542 RepID=A0AAV3ZYZ7_9GAST|nr:hypothetical protein PoB_002638500 [Plakobranchus ocellatus]